MTLRQLIEQRIKQEQAGACAAVGLEALREVAGAASFEMVRGGRISTPGAYVYPMAGTAKPNEHDDDMVQLVRTPICVLIAVRNVADTRHGDSSDLAEAYAGVVSGLLLGWQPEEAATPLEYSGWRIVGLTDGVLYRQENYFTETLRRAA